MDKKIKAIFFDVDGTLYWHDIHDVMASSKKAIQELQKEGYKVGIATSRCAYEFCNTTTFLREFPFDGMIFDGGALIKEHGNIFYQNALEVEDVKLIMKYALENQLSVRYSTNDGNYFVKEENAQMKDNFFKLYLNMPIVKPYEGELCNNILLYTKDDKQNQEIIQQLHDVNISDHESLIEITACGTNKASAIERLVTSWGLKMEEVMCFGDGFNDIEMLMHAGVGVAMGNGQEKCKEVANYVCESLYDDGVMKILKELKLL